MSGRFKFDRMEFAGSNLMIGPLFLALVVLLGDNIVGRFNLLPMSILGVLLVFAGAQLTLTIMDLKAVKTISSPL